MKNVSESLAGRADIVELETLFFAEIRATLLFLGIRDVITDAFRHDYHEQHWCIRPHVNRRVTLFNFWERRAAY